MKHRGRAYWRRELEPNVRGVELRTRAQSKDTLVRKAVATRRETKCLGSTSSFVPCTSLQDVFAERESEPTRATSAYGVAYPNLRIRM
eukprot:5682543-Pleurochrysis_carterae.AAC.1